MAEESENNQREMKNVLKDDVERILKGDSRPVETFERFSTTKLVNFTQLHIRKGLTWNTNLSCIDVCAPILRVRLRVRLQHMRVHDITDLVHACVCVCALSTK